MKFSIITPSLNMLGMLKKCHASVLDQNIDLEHIIVDAHSTDGTAEWLKSNTNLLNIVEADSGMYEAINKGIRISDGEIIGHLNCDEQYLPQTLQLIRQLFEQNPSIDIIHGNKINIYPDGKLNSVKQSIPFNKYFVLASNLYVPTCATFYRKRIFDNGYYFDSNYIACGDAEFMLRLKSNGFRFKYINKYLSAFTVHNHNMSQNQKAYFERLKFVSSATILPNVILKAFLIFKVILKFIYTKIEPLNMLTYNIYTHSIFKRENFVYKNPPRVTKW